jgi:hypothetical protein
MLTEVHYILFHATSDPGTPDNQFMKQSQTLFLFYLIDKLTPRS